MHIWISNVCSFFRRVWNTSRSTWEYASNSTTKMHKLPSRRDRDTAVWACCNAATSESSHHTHDDHHHVAGGDSRMIKSLKFKMENSHKHTHSRRIFKIVQDLNLRKEKPEIEWKWTIFDRIKRKKIMRNLPKTTDDCHWKKEWKNQSLW